MPPLPVLSAGEVVRLLTEHFGWRVARGGNHIILVRDGALATLSVPNHRSVARGTLRSLLRSAQIAPEDFIAAISR
jgi:predicted RNA binding protein YcfA (HicA-like mRNA interferase family)